MKQVWSWLAKILIIVVIVQGWFIYQFLEDKKALSLENQALTAQLETAVEQINKNEKQIAILKKKSVEGLLDETNRAVISGWEALMNKVEDELDKALESFPESIFQPLEESLNPSQKQPNDNALKDENSSDEELPFGEGVSGERT